MSADPTGAPAIGLYGVSKSFVPSVPVLDHLSLEVPHGQITALVGANGSGKSTLVKVLSGYHSVDPGSCVEVGGVDVTGRISPELMRSLGVRFVHQDAALAGGMSVVDNLCVGGYNTDRAGRIRWARERADVQSLLDRWSIDAAPDVLVERLPRATIAKLAVLRAARTAEGEPLTAIVLDEPTAALGQEDADDVLGWARSMAAQENVGVLFISHRLDEILGSADSVAVLRGGRIVAQEASAALGHDRLVEHIVGGSIGAFYPDRVDTSSGRSALSVDHLAGGGVSDVSFSVAEGEVLGLTGLPGSGFEDVPYLLMDPDTRAVGSCELGGRPLSLRRSSIRDRVHRGMVLIPADRKRTAVAADMTVRENLSLPRLRSFIRGGLLRRRSETSDSTRLVEEFSVQPPRPELPMGRLSGGNQQKVVLAKWLSTAPSVLLVHEPTQAVDVGAKAEIFRLLADTTAHGSAAVIASVEYEDLAHLCTRVLVFGRGTVRAELTGSALTTESITSAAFLASSEHAGPSAPAPPSVASADAHPHSGPRKVHA